MKRRIQEVRTLDLMVSSAMLKPRSHWPPRLPLAVSTCFLDTSPRIAKALTTPLLDDDIVRRKIASLLKNIECIKQSIVQQNQTPGITPYLYSAEKSEHLLFAITLSRTKRVAILYIETFKRLLISY